MEEVFNFLRELNLNNNKIWFDKNKERYQKIRVFIESFTQELINGISEFDSKAKYLSPKECTYRIYRDIRFSQDKTPYKTHIGIFINPPFGKKSFRMGYYLHLEPDNSSIGVGNIDLPPVYINAIRQSIKENIEEYLEIIEKSEFKRYFKKIGENPVKTAPKGFSKDWKYIELVKPKDFYTSHTLKEKELLAQNFHKKAVDIFKSGFPFMNFINYTIDEIGDSKGVGSIR
ncbi:MAG: DUF2461 domain-containing protein [Muribaculaceae bacterium]|nr:DUF2461 domain-containing protein [Muribaculaceae bacterium]